MVEKYITIKTATQRYSLCRNTIVRLAKDAEALYKIGRAVRIDSEKLDQYLEDNLAVTNEIF